MQEQYYPRLRKDLRLSRQETPDGPRFVVKDPETQRFFRFREAEHAVIRRMDGATPLDIIAEEVSAELKAKFDVTALESLVNQLRLLGLLEGSMVTPPKRRLVQGSLLWLRLKAFDPDRLLNRMIGRLGFFFTPYFIVISATTIACALVLTAASHAAILRDMSGLWRVENLLLAWIAVFVVTAGHEFAHGLTCKRFGGEVHEMGFLLIYFQPAFYCNISDAWLFREKARRLWVTFAGAYFELFVWAVATLLWRVAERGTWVSAAALVVMATSGVKIFLNLNPLIKLDGYYLLSDLLDVPNLRRRAFSYTGGKLKRLLGFRTSDEIATPRERGIFLGYGLVAAAFSYWLLSLVAMRLGSYLTSRYQGWGFLAFGGLLTATFWAPIRRHFPQRKGGQLPQSIETAKKPPAWSSPKVMFLALGAGALLLLSVVPLNLTVSGEFTLLPRHNADVRAEVEGIIERMYMTEGQEVVAGDTIARLGDREYAARLAAIEAESAEKTARLEQLRAGPRAEEIKAARVAVAKARERAWFAQAELDRTELLVRREFVPRVELERAQELSIVRAKELQEAQAALELVNAGARPGEIRAAQHEVAKAEAERVNLERQLNRVTVLAPHGGVVITPRLEEKVGEFVKPGDLIAEIYALETAKAEILVPERDIGEVRMGQVGKLRLRAYPDREFRGRVTEIAAATTVGSSSFERTVRVDVEIDNASRLLKPGLTGQARLYCGERRALDIVTKGIRRFLRVEFWSWW